MAAQHTVPNRSRDKSMHAAQSTMRAAKRARQEARDPRPLSGSPIRAPGYSSTAVWLMRPIVPARPAPPHGPVNGL